MHMKKDQELMKKAEQRQKRKLDCVGGLADCTLVAQQFSR